MAQADAGGETFHQLEKHIHTYTFRQPSSPQVRQRAGEKPRPITPRDKIECMSAGHRSSPPAFLAPLFWDVDFADLDMTRDGDYVLGRILSTGTLDAIRWARASFGDERIRDWIVQHHGRQLSGPQIRYWETVVGLPAELVAAWLATPERRLWEGATGT